MSQYSRRPSGSGNGRSIRPVVEEVDTREPTRGKGLENRFPMNPNLNPRPVYPQQIQLRPIQQQQPVPETNRNTPGGYKLAENKGPGPQGLPRIGSQSGQGRSRTQDQEPPNVAYRSQPPVRPQPRYSKPNLEDDVPVSPTSNLGTPSMASSRSIFIGFDPSFSNLAPPPPLSHHPLHQRRIPPPTVRRGTSSYYSQGPNVVSPIPEESDRARHGSFASSHVIPSSWGSGPPEFYLPAQSDISSDSEEEYSPKPVTGEEEGHGLVRQASLGRKSRPIITEIRTPSRQEQRPTNFLLAASSSNSVTSGTSLEKPNSESPAEKSSPTLQLPGTATTDSISTSSSRTTSPFTPFPIAEASKSPIPFNFSQSPDHSDDSQNSSLPPTSGRLKGRSNIPARLNMMAVREAEARGSLTSLPDLIRRATKLAAHLEKGRPDSRWGMRGSYTESSLNSKRRTDSISDILASFPPPALAARGSRQTRVMSQWPIQSDFQEMDGRSSLKSPPKKGRKVCGLPLWAFILLVILALLVIAAAVIVPLQLVTLSRNQDSASNNDNRDGEILRNCRQTKPCQNGGENVATSDYCGCVCTGGFGGPTCSQPADSSCITTDLQFTRLGSTVDGIQNATMGAAIQRLLEVSKPQYNIVLDASRLLSTFSDGDISCTAQNALVTFNGKTAPPEADTNTPRKRQETPFIVDTTAPPPVPSPTTSSITSPSDLAGTRSVQLDETVVDFARVAVLWLTQYDGLDIAVEAQQELQETFKPPNGSDFGQVAVGNGIVVDLDVLIIDLPGDISVGGPTQTPPTAAPEPQQPPATRTTA